MRAELFNKFSILKKYSSQCELFVAFKACTFQSEHFKDKKLECIKFKVQTFANNQSYNHCVLDVGVCPLGGEEGAQLCVPDVGVCPLGGEEGAQLCVPDVGVCPLGGEEGAQLCVPHIFVLLHSEEPVFIHNLHSNNNTFVNPVKTL